MIRFNYIHGELTPSDYELEGVQPGGDATWCLGHDAESLRSLALI